MLLVLTADSSTDAIRQLRRLTSYTPVEDEESALPLVIFVQDKGDPEELDAQKEVTRVAAKDFPDCTIRTLSPEFFSKDWPTRNRLFARVCADMSERNKSQEPWLFVSEDALPLQDDWLGVLAEEAQHSRSPMLGFEYRKPEPHYALWAIYPANFIHRVPFLSAPAHPEPITYMGRYSIRPFAKKTDLLMVAKPPALGEAFEPHEDAVLVFGLGNAYADQTAEATIAARPPEEEQEEDEEQEQEAKPAAKKGKKGKKGAAKKALAPVVPLAPEDEPPVTS